MGERIILGMKRKQRKQRKRVVERSIERAKKNWVRKKFNGQKRNYKTFQFHIGPSREPQLYVASPLNLQCV